ncbi:hypothetical protein BDR05DRAFT_950952 [Suillus weaverae]|nr:hypothetical protein BDR05DRAFT_950952 [Suillus weaverae]
MPYYGFYKNGRPLLNTFLLLTMTLELSINLFTGCFNDWYIAAKVNIFLDLLLVPWMTMIQSTKESYMWFFSCGPLVNNTVSFTTLQQSVLKQVSHYPVRSNSN